MVKWYFSYCDYMEAVSTKSHVLYILDLRVKPIGRVVELVMVPSIFNSAEAAADVFRLNTLPFINASRVAEVVQTAQKTLTMEKTEMK